MQQNVAISNVILTGFLLRVLVSVWNGFWGPSPGADLDALGLNGFASDVAESGVFEDFRIGYVSYTNVLGFVYGLTFNHVFFGSLLSSVAWWFSARALHRSLQVLGAEEGQSKVAMQLYSYWPTSILFTSVTIREPYQLMFVSIAAMAFVELNLKRSGHSWLLLAAALACASTLHGALFAFALFFLIGCAFVFVVRTGPLLQFNTVLAAVAVVSLVYLEGAEWLGLLSYNLESGLVDAIGAYQGNLLGIDARTTYKADVNLDGLGGAMMDLLVGFVQYLFEPMPWRISSADDLLILLENLTKFWLIRLALQGLREPLTLQQRALNFLFLSYLVLEFIWSVGTTNWGTSVRHHIPAFGLLLLAAFGRGRATPAACAATDDVVMDKST